jgi:3-oxoacyl-[acyl-carrier-protein] synthase-3
MKIRMESIGVFTPEKVVTTKELIDQLKQPPLIDLEELTGVRTRRMRGEGESSYTIGLAAAQTALEISKYNAEDLDIIISCSITRYKEYPDYLFEPALSLYIKRGLGAKKAINFDISNACAGMMTGAYVLNSMIKSGAVKNGMVLSGECITPLSETAVKEISKPMDEQFASLTVGDAGAAFILDHCPEDEEEVKFVDAVAIAEFSDLCFAMSSEQGPGVAMYTDSRRIHKESIIRGHIAVDNLCERQGKGFDADDFDYVIPHQTSSKAIATFLRMSERYFKKEMPEALYAIHDFGNTSSTSLWVVLYNHLKSGKVKRGDRVLLIAVASGIIFGVFSVTIGPVKV